MSYQQRTISPLARQQVYTALAKVGKMEILDNIVSWAATLAVACALSCSSLSAKGSDMTANASPATPGKSQLMGRATPRRESGAFDGQKAYEYTAKLVSFGPRPSGSPAIRRMQDYIAARLRSDGCKVGEDDFQSHTPIGTIAMRNIVAKTPGKGKNVILLLTHADTKRIPDFVGADDGGSSTGLMLEMANLLCRRKQPLAVWMAFLDGEEAMTHWNVDQDHTYGSRELAASLALSGQLKNVKAVILVDMIGQKGLHILKESTSTPWLTNLVWSTATKLGYQNVFLPAPSVTISDDHDPFLARGVPAVDLIDLLDYQREGYWHTPKDTMDKISPRSLRVVGRVILASVKALEANFSP